MPSNEINIENVFLILRMRMRLIAGALALGVFIAAIVTYQTPKMYRATASLNFEFSSNNPLEDGESKALAQASYLVTQIGILSSLNVAQYVVDSLSDYEKDQLMVALDAKISTIGKLTRTISHFISSLFEDKRSRGSDSGGVDRDSNARVSRERLVVDTPYEKLSRWIGNDLQAIPVFNSRIVEISYFSTNPKLAAIMANKYSEAYIVKNLKMITDPAYSKKIWFDEQLKSLLTRLERAQAKLTAYQQQEGIVSSGERIDLETSRLEQLSGQLLQARQATRNAETMQRKLDDVMRSGAPLDTFEPVFSNSVVQKVKAEIRTLEGELVEGSSSLGDNHPVIVKLRSELRGARSRLKAEIQSITDGIANGSDLAKQREFDIAQEVEAQKAIVLNLKGEHDRISVLQREVESARSTYNAALSQLNTASMMSMVNQTNVSVVDYATIPSRPATPKVAKNLAVGGFGGLLLGVGTALFMGIFVRKIQSKEDLISELGLPLLGHLKS